MQLPAYSLSATNDDSRYDFVSLGPKGAIAKQIRFALLHGSDVYNLTFGDYNSETHTLDDQIISDNGDLEMILATVAAAAFDCCQCHPGVSVFVVGNTAARTRLYRMAIARYLSDIQTLFEIYGELGDTWEPFQPNRPYTAFFAQLNDCL